MGNIGEPRREVIVEPETEPLEVPVPSEPEKVPA